MSLQPNIAPAIQQAVEILRANLAEYTEKFPDSASVNGVYPQVPNEDWTTGFCTGTYWLAWELTGEECFKTAALKQVDNFLERIEKHIMVDHHDMGFLYSLSCVAAFRLTGSEAGKKAAIMAAENLISRFQEKGQFIQAWGELGAENNYRLIIDCLMNLPLLYWASETTGKEIFRDIALKHTDTSLANLIRPDHSTYHTFFFNKETGKPDHGATHQGYKDDSAWARGQAWGVYGLALSYRYTKKPRCIELFRQVTDFFLSKLPKDHVPYWDFTFNDENGNDEPRDSSAAAIAVCGILEMEQYLPAEEAARYHESAMLMLDSLIQNYAVKTPKSGSGLILHGTYAKTSPYNTVSNIGVDEFTIWGDYYYLEALTRMQKKWNPYW